MLPFSDLIAPVLAFAAGLPALTLALLLWRRTGDRSFELLATGLGLLAVLAFLLSVGIFLAAARLVANPDLRFVLWNTTFILSFGSHLVLRRFASLVIPGPGTVRSFPRLFSLASAFVYVSFLAAAFAMSPPVINFSGRLVYALSALWYLAGYLGPALRLWRARDRLPSWIALLFARGPLLLGPAALVLVGYEILRWALAVGRGEAALRGEAAVDGWPSLGPLIIVIFFVLVTIRLFGLLVKPQGISEAAAGEGAQAANGAADRARRVAARCVADPLTKRELEILVLLLEGWRNQDIASRLGLSPNTVKNHVYSLYQKTGVANRVELMGLGD